MIGIRTMTRAALAVTAAAAVSGCDNFLAVNEDPNNPQSVDMELTLPGIFMAFSHEIIGPQDIRYGNMVGPTAWSGEWLGQWAWNEEDHTYAQFQWYEVANLDTNGYWSSGYADVMQEAVNIMRTTEQTGQTAFHGIAKFMFAWTGSLMTDAFGPIPFSEAFDTQNRNPTYDTQEEVYQTVFTLIDEAIGEMQQVGPNPPGYTDIVYKGDMDKWVRLANTVKARLHLRQAYAPGQNAVEHAQAALAALDAGFTGPDDVPLIAYDGDAAGSEQPWYLYADQGYGEPSRAAEYTVELLRSTNDPRLPIMIRPADLVCPAGGAYDREDCTLASSVVYRGLPTGEPGQPDSAISRLGSFFVSDSADVIWFTWEDAKLIEAEALLITSGAGAADVAYREAVRSNMERLGVASAEIDAYMTALPSLAAETQPLRAIIMQKYLVNFLRDEVWHDWRRTGYPEFTPVANAVIPGIPVRLRTPASEMQFNSEKLAETGISTGLDGMLVDVWWASGSPTVQ